MLRAGTLARFVLGCPALTHVYNKWSRGRHQPDTQLKPRPQPDPQKTGTRHFTPNHAAMSFAEAPRSAAGRPIRSTAMKGDAKQREIAAALAGTQASAFLSNTYEMLENPANASGVRWNAAGTSVIVDNVRACSDVCVPRVRWSPEGPHFSVCFSSIALAPARFLHEYGAAQVLQALQLRVIRETAEHVWFLQGA